MNNTTMTASSFEFALRVRGLTKSYGKVRTLLGYHLEVNHGEILDSWGRMVLARPHRIRFHLNKKSTE